MKIKDIVSGRPVISVRDTDELALAAQMMLWAGVHHLPVLDGDGRLVGVVGERDVLARRAAEGHDGDRVQVVKAMLASPATVSLEDEVAEAARRMVAREVSCLPVLDGAGWVVGMLTATDLVRLEAAPRLTARDGVPLVRDVMRVRPLTAVGDDHLMDALARMAERGVRHLPVVTGDRRLVGILSDRDVRTAVGDPTRAVQLEGMRVRLQSMRVSDVMTRRVLTTTPDTPLADAAARFVDHRIGAIPVVEGADRLVGILSYVDALRVASFDWPAASRKGHAVPAETAP